MEQPSVNLVALNPQPLPPDATINLVALNPQPLPPKTTIDFVALNPQPLPPSGTLEFVAVATRPINLPVPASSDHCFCHCASFQHVAASLSSWGGTLYPRLI